MARFIVLACLLAAAHASGKGECATGDADSCADLTELLQRHVDVADPEDQEDKVVALEQKEDGDVADDDKVSEDAKGRMVMPSVDQGQKKVCGKKKWEILKGMPKSLWKTARKYECPRWGERQMDQESSTACPCDCESCFRTWTCINAHYKAAGKLAQAACDKVKAGPGEADASEELCTSETLKPCRLWEGTAGCYANITLGWFPETTKKKGMLLVDMAARAKVDSSSQIGVDSLDETLEDKCA